jgi:Lamin Tail Domain
MRAMWRGGPLLNKLIRRNKIYAWIIISMLMPACSFEQNRYDVLITEFLPDPSPPVGLPEASFIELKNRSRQDYNLRGWKISDGNSAATIKTDWFLKSDSFLILCPTSAVKDFIPFGPTLGVSSFPSLNNDADNIILIAADSQVIHALHYKKDWFENELKAGGGWSLEMIDPENPCAGMVNWKASISPTGGTPGHLNSINAGNPDHESPSLLRAYPVDSMDLDLVFDEPMDSSLVSNPSNFFISGEIGSPVSAAGMPPGFDHARLLLRKRLDPGKIYEVTANQVADCCGNTIGNNICQTGIPVKAAPFDIIINEILFNPPPAGSDYIELFNRSNSIIDCSALWIMGRDSYGALQDPGVLTQGQRLLFPGEYIVLTEDPAWILQNYPSAPSFAIIQLTSFPSMPDDMGKIVLANNDGQIIDELDYDHHWHSPLLSGESGVALERIHSDTPSSAASNWASAAASTGFGTPGLKNSEYMPATAAGNEWITLEPKIFSPDLDGYQDYLFIQYQLPAAGFIGSITVFDVFGRAVRKLVNNSLWGTHGEFRWDGLDENMQPLSMGHYIMYIELFLPEGAVIKKKLVCTLARNP